MFPWVKHSLWRHKDLSLNPQNPCRAVCESAEVCKNPSTPMGIWEAEKESLETHEPLSLGYTVAVRPHPNQGRR